MRTNDEIIALIDLLRIEKKLSISELARRTNMAKSGLSMYINGKRQFSLDRIDDFAKALNTSVEFLLFPDTSKQTEIDLAYLKNKVVLFEGEPLSDETISKIEKMIKLSFELERKSPK